MRRIATRLARALTDRAEMDEPRRQGRRSRPSMDRRRRRIRPTLRAWGFFFSPPCRRATHL